VAKSGQGARIRKAAVKKAAPGKRRKSVARPKRDARRKPVTRTARRVVRKPVSKPARGQAAGKKVARRKK
jgi:hypothetical protein